MKIDGKKFRKTLKHLRTMFDDIPKKDYPIIKTDPIRYAIDRIMEENPQHGTAERFTIMITGNEEKIKDLEWILSQ